VSPVKYELGFYIPQDGILHEETAVKTSNLHTIQFQFVRSTTDIRSSLYSFGFFLFHVCFYSRLRDADVMLRGVSH
jgi:hypothetical protein